MALKPFGLWQQRAISQYAWKTHHYGEPMPTPAKIKRDHPGLPLSEYRRMVEAVRRSVTISERFLDLKVDQPFSTLLGSYQRPSSEVTVYWKVYYEDPRTGNIDIRTARVDIPWEMHLADAMAEGLRVLQAARRGASDGVPVAIMISNSPYFRFEE